MITRVLILQCDFCTRSTRIRGGFVTEAALAEKAIKRGWTRTPDPQFPQISPTDRCPKCAHRTRRPAADTKEETA